MNILDDRAFVYICFTPRDGKPFVCVYLRHHSIDCLIVVIIKHLNYLNPSRFPEA
jgi:hypothetical protein